MKEKVIFDTNIIRNAEAKNFLGGRNELERFADVADIVIPDIVIQEIKRQKRKNLQSNKKKFLDNPFHNLLEIDESNTNAFDVDDYIEKLVNDEDFTFEIIDIKDNNVLPKIKELAVKKKPPFEGRDNTDKGFKDALLYFSVLEYLQEIPNKNVFVCAKDGRLKEALDAHQNIIVVESYDEFKIKSVSQFYDEYFIEQVKKELNIEITSENIIEHWTNFDDNQNVLISLNGDEFVVEVDSGEIVNSANKNQFLDTLQKLIASPNWNNTDLCVDELEKYKTLFSEDETNSLLIAAYDNTQIRWIIDKDALIQFFGPLYLSSKHLVEPEKQTFFNEIFE
tara:strand:- start:191 stop:1201 length:1011 start_codon:yes stop_codon:yes gene_type:complete